ncbi:MAG: PepSY domain-containing protein [Candidatus Onthomonas sp.]
MKNNRLFAVLCTLSLSLALLTGCGAKSGNPDAVYPQPAGESAQNVITGTEAQTAQQPEGTTAGDTTQSSAVQVETGNAQTGSISQEEATDIALQDAGLTRDQVSNLKVYLDEHDDDRHDDVHDHSPEYDISFYADGTEYEYEIDAADGSIRFRELEQKQQAAGSQVVLSQDEATEIALQHAGCTVDAVTKLRVELDEDHDRQVYEVEFHSGRTKYEYKIDAATGDILSYDADLD